MKMYVIFVLACLLTRSSRALNLEGQALLELKSKWVDEFHHLDNWNPEDRAPCNWKGVNCTTDYDPVVSSLDLRAMNLSGTVSSGIGGLTQLTYLDLSFNGFSGAIPREIGNCSKLETLFLNNNNFEGQIPPNWETYPF
uniref:Leucine-rich repeat-containing N-terminal plant-type domain-containing protein n=1 Tax=Ananas comosus var. bracteatus TaxID=296719 RepID=A0A6V7PVU3_ANACO|nr:unnamed protein product [Ananas comosus var. bracteatus]